MCLSTAYETQNGVDKLLCERVTSVKVDGDKVLLTNLFGMQTEVTGALRSIDLEKNIILVEPKA